MPGLLQEACRTYAENLKLVWLFSIPFAIAFIIPIAAHLSTYVTLGGIFLSGAGMAGISVFSIAVIVVSYIFTLLFLSFAYVAISLIVKSRKTHSGIGKRALMEIEKHVGKVFVILMIYGFLLLAVNLASYALFPSAAVLITAIFGLLIGTVMFYAPSAVVIDNKRVGRAITDSVKLIRSSPQYYAIWVLLFAVTISVLDAIIIAIPWGPVVSGYVMLFLISIVILPYFVILQTEAYMRKFPLLSH